MKAFVTGATGFVGREIVRQLYDGGHSARFLVRNPGSPLVQEIISRYGAEIHVGDVLDPASMINALSGTGAAIHLVGIISELGEQTFENIHSHGTRNVVAAAQRAGVNRFLHMSALGTRPGAAARYHQTKWVAEEAVRKSGLDYTIFRPSLIYGPKDHFVNLFAKLIRRSPVVPVMGSGRARFQPVPVEDVAKAFAAALSEPRSIRQTYDLCGPETFTLPNILAQVLGVMGRQRLTVRVPLSLARCQAAFLEFAFPILLRQAPPLNRDQLIMLEEDNVGNGALANELFGLAPVSFRQGIARYLKRDP